ncbi:MAG: dihydroorotase [Nitrosomonadales bacterium]
MNYLFKNILVLDPYSEINTITDVLLRNNKIEDIKKNISIKQTKNTKIIDGKDKILIPDIVDIYCDLKSPGHEYKDILETELKSALKSGLTTLVCHPNTEPILDEPSLIKNLISISKKEDSVRVAPLAAITKKLEGLQLAEMMELEQGGAVGFSQAENSIQDTSILLKAFEYASTFDFTLFLRANESSLSENTYANESQVATRLGIKGQNKLAEIIEIQKYIELAKLTNAKIHISKLSCRESIGLVKKAKSEKVNITCDVSINNLTLTENDIDNYNTLCHLQPPLRSVKDKTALIQGLKDHTIDAICSDHCPVELDRKQLPFEESEPGSSNFETFISLVFKVANENKIPYSEIIKKISINPANIIKEKYLGMKKNTKATFTIFDKSIIWRPNVADTTSSGKNIAHQYEMNGKVIMTFINGKNKYKYN